MLILETYLANGFSSYIFHQLLKIMPFLVCRFSSIVIFERGRCFWLFFFSLTGRKKKNKVCTFFTQLLISSSFLILFSVTWAAFLKKKSFLELSWRQFSPHHVTKYFTKCSFVFLHCTVSLSFMLLLHFRVFLFFWFN